MDETKVIQEDMEHTRQSLAEKLETLEKKVEHTVESVTGSIAETAQTVTDTVQKAKDTVAGTVEAVTETVGSAVETVTETVKKTFDVRGHVRSYPWAMFGGSVLVGFLAGRLLGGRTREEEPYPAAPPPPAYPRGDGSGWQEERVARFEHNGARADQEQQREGESWLGQVAHQLAPLREMALGATLGVAREMLVKHLPENLRQGVAEMVDNLTTNLGGKPVKSSGETDGQGGPGRSSSYAG